MRFKINSMRLKLWSNHTRSNLNNFKLTLTPPQPKKNPKLNKNRKQSKSRKTPLLKKNPKLNKNRKQSKSRKKKKLNRKILIIK